MPSSPPSPAEASSFSLAHLHTLQMPLSAPISHLHLFLIFSNHPHGCRLMMTLQMSPVYRAREMHACHTSSKKQGVSFRCYTGMGLSIFTFLSLSMPRCSCMCACMHACGAEDSLGAHSSHTFFLDFGYKVSHWYQKLADQEKLNPPASVSSMLRLQTCAALPRFLHGLAIQLRFLC